MLVIDTLLLVGTYTELF